MTAATCPIRALVCHEHGFIHGSEAEELRTGIALVIACEDDSARRVHERLNDLLDNVDARDSLAFREATEDAEDIAEVDAARAEQGTELPLVVDGVVVADAIRSDIADGLLVRDSPACLPPPPNSGEQLRTLRDIEDRHIRDVMSAVGNKTRAAAILGIDRRTLYRKLHRMGAMR